MNLWLARNSASSSAALPSPESLTTWPACLGGRGLKSTTSVVCVGKGINEPRYPSFKGIMAAKSRPVTDYALADLEIDPGEVGAAGATTEVVDFSPRPPKQAGQVVKDSGDGSAALELAEFLASHKFI